MDERQNSEIIRWLKQEVEKEFEKAIKGAIKESADLIAERLREGIKEGRPGWEPLKPSTIKRKHHGQILYETGDYLEHIESWTDEDGLKGYAGVRAGIMHRRGRIEIAKLALIHEFGAPERNIPARPNFRIVERDSVKDIEKIFQIHIEKALELR